MNKIVAALLIVSFAVVRVTAQPGMGQRAFEIALPDAKGNIQKLSDHQGKVVLVDFWASWCGPCRRANPGLGTLYSKYRSKGFEIFGVSIDDDSKAWRKAIEADGITWKQVNAMGGTRRWPCSGSWSKYRPLSSSTSRAR